MGFKEVLIRIEEKGYKAAFTDISHVEDLKKEFDNVIKSGEVNTEVLKTIIEFDFDYSKLEHEAKSILVVSIRLPIINNDFTFKGKTHTLVTPPGYIPGKETSKFVQDIKEIFEETKYHKTGALLPVKMLSNKIGLTQYGRNNISYVDGFGSFHMLVAYYTDIPVSKEETKWCDVKRMDICENCSKCIKMCPTKCINPNKNVIDIGRCITRIYEGEGEFPEWIKPDHHNCLMACFMCQKACPANIKYLDRIDVRAAFDEEETNKLLTKTAFSELSTNTQEKLKGMGIDGYYDIFLRNLSVQPQFRD